MRELFDRLKSHRHSAIRELIDARVQESLQLEFKRKEDPATGVLSRTDRRKLGQALSAFANSAGGLLVWGIKAVPDPIDGVDAAQAAVPIAELARFQSEISRAIGELLMPRHDGIEIEPIEDSTQAGSGFLAIWVDRSGRRPHRSEVSGEKNYFKRIGASSYPMEHYDIEGAFNRIAPTQLRLVFDSRRDEGTFGSHDQTTYGYVLKFSLQNNDRRSASAPYVWVENAFNNSARVTRTVTGAQSKSTLEEFDYGAKQFFSGEGNVYIHPGVAVPAFELKIECHRRNGETIMKTNQERARDTAIAFEYGFGCAHARMTTGRFEIVGAKLEELLSQTLPRHFVEDNQPQDH